MRKTKNSDVYVYRIGQAYSQPWILLYISKTRQLGVASYVCDNLDL